MSAFEPDDLPRAPLFFGAITVVVLLIYASLAFTSARDLPRTADEARYIETSRVALEVGHWNHSDASFQGPFGLVFNQLLIGDLWTEATKAEISDEIVFRARLGMLPFGLLALLGVAYWTRSLFGDRAGAIAVTAYGLHPLVVGYGALVNVDMAHAATTLLSAFATALYVARGRWTDLAAVGIALGLAVGTKYLALTIAPCVALLVVVGATKHSKSQAGWRVLIASLMLLAVTVGTLHAVYLFRSGFAFGFQPESPAFQRCFGIPGFEWFVGILPMDLLAGLDRLLVFDGERTILYFGRYVENPKSYYLASLGLKSPPVVLLLALLTPLVWALGWRRIPERARSAGLVLLVLVVPPMLLLTFGSSDKVGVLYVLQFLPLCAVLAGALGWFADRWTARITCLALVIGSVPALAWWHPNHIAYFNPFATRDGVVRSDLFDDSNAEWGQNLERGPWLLEKRYGGDIDVLRGRAAPRFGRVAAYLHDLNEPDPEHPDRAHHWLTPFEPVAALDASWWVFEIDEPTFERAARASDDPRISEAYFVALVDAGRFERARAELANLAPDRVELCGRALDYFELGESHDPKGLADELHAAELTQWALEIREDNGGSPEATSDEEAQ